MTVQDNEFVSRLTQAARDNPLAAALIGGGALWLMLGNRAVGGAAAGLMSGARSATDMGVQGISRAADQVSTTAVEGARSLSSTIGEATASGVEALRQSVSGAVGKAGEAVAQTTAAAQALPNPGPSFETAYGSAQKAYGGAQSALTELLDRQPLVLAAIGLAIGAGVAGAIAGTAVENEWAGSVSDEVKSAVSERTQAVADKAGRAAGEIGNEFRAAASQTAEKLRTVGQQAARSF
jgi:hypothetical protein